MNTNMTTIILECQAISIKPDSEVNCPSFEGFNFHSILQASSIQELQDGDVVAGDGEVIHLDPEADCHLFVFSGCWNHFPPQCQPKLALR